MARRVGPLEISFDGYRAVFGDSVEEGTEDIEGDGSDIDFSGIDEDGVEGDEEATVKVAMVYCEFTVFLCSLSNTTN